MRSLSLVFTSAAYLLLLLERTASGKQRQNIFTITADDKNREVHKRSTTQSSVLSAKVSNLTTAFHLNNSHLHLMVHWAGQGSSVMFCLARDQDIRPGATSRVFMSEDYGTTFKDVSEKFKVKKKNATINKFYHHPKNNCLYVFTDVIHRYIFTSKDCGKSFQSIPLAFSPELVEFDELRGSVFLIHDLLDPYKKLYVTQNFGESISHVHDYVKSFYFYYKDEGTELFIQRLRPSNDGTSNILASKNFFERQLEIRVVYNGASEFEIRENLMFVTRRDPTNPKYKKLYMASVDMGRFVEADFGIDFNVIDYHIVDVTKDGQVLVCANINHVTTDLYVSTKINDYEVEFSLSLERVMFYNPNVTWHDSWLADTAGDVPFVDVYKIQGLRGIYIASQVKDSYNDSRKDIQPDDLISYITFDQGGIWSKIQGPFTDEEGYKFPNCDKINKCSLHLSQQLSKKFPSTRSIPILSSPSAVGIVMATGNMGQNLKQRSNVYLSADAGLSWHQVLKGSYYYNIGDHGGIIVAIKYFKTEGWSNELLYSTNEGVEWKPLIFYKEPLRIFGLLTEPGENTTIFTMFGTSKTKRGVDWIIIKVDLKSVFSHNCTADDYKRWSPSDNSIGKHRNCLLGRKEIFERRIINSNCYNGRNHEVVITVENCGCDRSDFQCDFGFVKDQSWTGSCIVDKKFEHDPYAIPANCPEGGTYNRTSGYIKIPGDSCSGGKESRFLPTKVACPVGEEKEFLLVAQRKQIIRVNLRNFSEVEILPLSGIKNVIALEFDMEENCVIWGDIDLDRISIQCLNGSEPRILVENSLNSVEGMSYDWITKTLYFVDGMRLTIELVRTDIRYAGRMRKTILDGKLLKKPRGIVVHPIHGYLFYSDWNEKNPVIGRANMDGTEPTILFAKPLVRWPNGLSIDYIANRIYWVDAQQDFIASSDLDGKGFKKILGKDTSWSIAHPFSVAVHKELMYWDDWEKKAVFLADKNSGASVNVILSDMEYAMDLKVFSHGYRSGKNSCSVQHRCSHLCVAMPNSGKAPGSKDGYRCMCPDGMKESEDEDGIRSCLCPDNSKPALNGTCQQQANGKCQEGQFQCRNQLCIPQQWKCDGDDDCGDRSDESDCVQDVCREYQFQCTNRKCIPIHWRCDFDDDCGDNSDEVDCTHAQCTKDQFKCDNGQCINNKWKCDLEKDCQDGSDEEHCVPKGAPVCKTDEFKCEKTQQCLPNSWKCDGDVDCPDGSDEEDCDGKTCQDWQFQCGNSHCIFKTWRCDGDNDCPDGSDEINCTSTEPQEPKMPVPVFPKGECNQWMFKCKNEQCIPYWWKCDGTPDCADSSDEIECGSSHVTKPPSSTEPNYPSSGCPGNKFQCRNKSCVWQAWVCDGENDCSEGEDEDKNLCKGKVVCHAEDYRCEFSGECIPNKKLCDGRRDCTDGTDENGCVQEPDDNHTPTCKAGFFQCDFGECVPDSAICDGHLNCLDASDEVDCHHHDVYQVLGLTIDEDLVTSSSITIHWWLADLSITDDLLFEPVYKVAGIKGAEWKSVGWQSISDSSFTFDGLHSYMRYNFTVNIKAGGVVHQSTHFVIGQTLASKPSKPLKFSVTQEGDLLSFQWSPPTHPNGDITNYRIYISPPDPPMSFDTNSAKRSFRIQMPLNVGDKYVFYIEAQNVVALGDPSEKVSLVYDEAVVRDSVKNLEVLDITTSSVTVRWIGVRYLDPEVVRYKINYKSPTNAFATYKDIYVDAMNNPTINVTVTGLSPAENYILKVSAIKGNNTGPVTGVRFTTSGTPLPKPIINDVQVSPERGTSIKLSWDLPAAEKRKLDWVYAIYYGASQGELLNNGRRFVTKKTSYTIDRLNACEDYIFVVNVIGPLGYGPASDPHSHATKFSPGAPPKNFQARKDEDNEEGIILTWDSSCPNMEERIGYVISVTDTVINRTSFNKLAPVNSSRFFHKINRLHYGGIYKFKIKTDTANSDYTDEIAVYGPEIPTPVELTHRLERETGNQFVYWYSTHVPTYIGDDLSYQLFLSKFENFSNAKIFNVSQPPYVISHEELESGVVYYLSVKLLDSEGYSSKRSAVITMEAPYADSVIVVSEGGAAGVLIPIFIIIILLASALGLYVYRHRRLTSSFQAFASRYTPASGAAILNQSTLNDDDDSPIIRGFSDDEPLVVT